MFGCGVTIHPTPYPGGSFPGLGGSPDAAVDRCISARELLDKGTELFPVLSAVCKCAVQNMSCFAIATQIDLLIIESLAVQAQSGNDTHQHNEIRRSAVRLARMTTLPQLLHDR